jgi:hypothetical protein
VRVLRGFGIALGVLLLLGAGGWQLWHEDGGILKSLPTKQEREVAGAKEIAVYCQYGGVSVAQLRGCYMHVHIGEIEGRDTNAARWARGELDECLADAGPYCDVKYRTIIEHRVDKKAATGAAARNKLDELEKGYGSP